MDFDGLGSLAAHFERIAAQAAAAEAHNGLEKAASLLADKARDAIGEYHDAVGPIPAWEPLADATKADRVAQGYPEDEPLLRSGELRDSIGHEVSGNTAWVGSTSDLAPFHEFGTSRMPPRPIFGTALYENISEVVHEVGLTATAKIRGQQ
ncbi:MULTISPECIES: HK97-gp10 family putative phage morphogenesis protein [unclassified Novosphingobium]|uniref:HK97-gp10 family putative phage morphogenesis protein n=1 Tax=unclassified Novosphingobium TaxID=2644732 RepID=UPI000D3090CF|nr:MULTISPECIES: HK97-gp10 family putative phage morphogenesis protein [unclassified Novosphingobium]PTR05283.1 HK97 gp10 family phage protein [Novosphingobium sp. GV055]PUA93852.1 HK97 gp10 family phage protein [Novosphingobium sp. GV061]PUB11112.1 HK97 gp10 family phage protein [Novosphingobium sp. GV079]PUB36508.1 HK97 gp10 family phage protein [Novosphingobium sp. GV027]